METVSDRSPDVFAEAVKKLDISVLISQLTFVKVLAEGFDFLAADCCNGLEAIAELCELRSGDLKRIGMEDEAELLAHLKDNLGCDTEGGSREKTSTDGRTDEIDILYRVEFVRIVMEKLIKTLENKLNGMFKRHLRAA